MTDQTPRLNRHGSVDVDYYMQVAMKQRSEYIASLSSALKARIKAFFHLSLPTTSTSH